MSTENRPNWARGKKGSPAQQEPVSWRGAGKKGGLGNGKQPRRPWWRTGDGHEQMKHTMLLVLSFGIIVVLAVAWYRIWQGRTQTPLIALVVADYRSPLTPPNSMAQEDIGWFFNLWTREDEHGGVRKTDIGFWGDATSIRCEGTPQFLKRFTDKLADTSLRFGGPDKDTVLIYISAHGAVNSQGQPCLLLSDSAPHDDNTWMPLKDVLSAIESCLDQRKEQDRPIKKVVFLDASRMLYNLHLGVLYNAFNEQLKETVDGVADPYLVVVSAARGGEISWPAPEYGRTVFGHFVGRGLSGLVADRDGDPDIVSLGELADYLGAEVPAWVRTYRAASQHPNVIATGNNDSWREWKLAWTSETSRALAEAATKLSSPPPEILERAHDLDTLWRRYDDVVDQDTARLAPLELAELQLQLVRGEQLLLAGQAYRGRLVTLKEGVNDLLDILSALRNSVPATALNLPAAERRISPDQLQAFVREWDATPHADQWKEVPFPRDVVSAGILQWLLARKAQLGSVAQLDNIIKMIDSSPPAPASKTDARETVAAPNTASDAPELVEVHWLRMLQKYLDREAISSSGPVEAAILTRCLAEKAATTGDQRVHYWVQTRIQLADQERRLAEDRLLVGTPRAIAAAQTAWAQLLNDDNGLYTLADKEAQELTRAYHVHDAAWAQLPELAKWLMVKAVHRQPVTVDDFKDLAEVAEQVHQLGTLLDNPLVPTAGVSDPEKLASWIEERSELIRQILELRDTIAQKIDARVQDYRATWEEQARKRDRTVGGLWGDMLQVALVGSNGVPGRMRGEQRRKFLDLLFASDDTAELSTGGGKSGVADSDGDGEALLNLLAQVAVHPVRSMLHRPYLGGEGEPTDPTLQGNTLRDRSMFLAAQSHQVRELLNENALVAKAQQLAGELETDMAAHQDVRQTRLNLSRADRLLRAAAGLTELYAQIASRRNPAPTRTLQEFDSHYYLIWQAHRALLDLWSDEDSPQDPYYLRTFEAYCDAAQAAYTMYEHPYQYDGVDLEVDRDNFSRQFDMQQSATPGIAGRPREEGDSLEFDVTIDPGADTPAGEPFVTVQTPGAQAAISVLPISAPALGDTTAGRVGIPIGPEKHEQPIALRLEKSHLGKQVTLVGTGFFRGRKRISPITLPNPELGEEFVIERRDAPPPSVKVTGTSAKKIAIMFVVDCSYSMSNPLKDEGSRLRVATQALESILSTLCENRDVGDECRVGLLAFSHRVGFASDRSTEIIRTKAYEQWLKDNPTEQSKTPDDDLEMIVRFDNPGNPLSEKLKQELVEKSRQWRPMGNTPLYYSLSEALKAFQAVPDVQAKHLIVITDGNDEIYGVPPWLKSFRTTTGKKDFDAEQVGLLLRDQYPDVDVSVLGIALSSFRGKDPINALAQRSIQFYTVSRQQELVSRIETALGLGSYSVQDDKKRLRAVTQRIPRVSVLDQWDRAEAFEVSMPDWKPAPQPARLFIEGGEAFDLVLDADQSRIVHRRYAPPERHPTVAESPDAYVSALYPERAGDRVTFPISIQNLDPTKFSPRPVGVWATITPLRAASGDVVGPPYHFVDRQFEYRTPVPVSTFTVNNWPREANWARLELWFRVAKELDVAFEDVPANEEKNLTNTRDLEAFQVDGISGVTLSARLEPLETGDGVRVIVEERYENGNQDVQRSRIMAMPTADKIVRSYNRDGGLARHVFEYYGAINQPRKLLITSRERIQQAYSPLAKPLSVKLPPRD